MLIYLQGSVIWTSKWNGVDVDVPKQSIAEQTVDFFGLFENSAKRSILLLVLQVMLVLFNVYAYSDIKNR